MADKGGATVIMEKQHYENKLREMLADENTYTIETKKTLVKLQKKGNDLMGRLCKEKVITEEQRKNMIQYNSQLPRIYALPKIHKSNVPADIPLRPIVSTIDGPAAKHAIFFDKLLKPLAESEFDIITPRNSQQVERHHNE